LISILLNL